MGQQVDAVLRAGCPETAVRVRMTRAPEHDKTEDIGIRPTLCTYITGGELCRGWGLGPVGEGAGGGGVRVAVLSAAATAKLLV